MKTMHEADKYEVVILKKLGMTHIEARNRLQKKSIEISRGQISKIMKRYEKTRRLTTKKKRPGRPRKLSDS